MQVSWKATGWAVVALTAGSLIAACQTTGGGSQTQGVRNPRQAESHNMQLVGHNDMQARSIYAFLGVLCVLGGEAVLFLRGLASSAVKLSLTVSAVSRAV
jgi:hypothetical protein